MNLKIQKKHTPVGCIVLIQTNLDMPISKHASFLFTVCIAQNINQNRLIVRYKTPHNLIS